MYTPEIVMGVIIVVLLIDRILDRNRWMKQVENLNRALIAKHTADYDYNSKDELKKMKLENDLAIKAQELIDRGGEKEIGPHFPIT